MSKRFFPTACITTMLVLCGACGGAWSSGPPPAPSVPPAAPIPSDAGSTDAIIRSLEDKIKRNPDDFAAYNKLAGYYLQRLRETGSVTYIDLAERSARKSLEVLPAEANQGALSALAQVENASHNFAAARDHALQLREWTPNKTYPHQILGDALLELGDYDGASAAFNDMERVGGPSVQTETRFARLSVLRGNLVDARNRYTDALTVAVAAVPPQQEPVAWLRWQLGEIAFQMGDYPAAERHYTDSLTTFPDFRLALAGLGRTRAAQGDLAGAIEHFEKVTRIIPDPAFVSTLGDLYSLAGRAEDAAAKYELVEQIGRLSALNGALYNRQLALFYADHDMKAEEAYALAAAEYQTRRDVYGADALAWTALKAGKIDEARAAIKDALRLGTKDARLFFHAGMIARAAGDEKAASDFLKRALALSPEFDPLQAPLAKKALGH